MKKIFLVIVVLLVFQKWGQIDNYLHPPPDSASIQNSGVILYATSWCGYCRKARELLKENDIDYYEYDIEKSAEGREQYLKLDGNGVPLLLINGEAVRGYSRSQILKLAKKI